MIYFVWDNRELGRFYGNLKTLCEKEGLGYSKFSKHFAKRSFYRGAYIKIWKGELIRGTRNDSES